MLKFTQIVQFCTHPRPQFMKTMCIRTCARDKRLELASEHVGNALHQAVRRVFLRHAVETICNGRMQKNPTYISQHAHLLFHLGSSICRRGRPPLCPGPPPCSGFRHRLGRRTGARPRRIVVVLRKLIGNTPPLLLLPVGGAPAQVVSEHNSSAAAGGYSRGLWLGGLLPPSLPIAR